MKALIKLIRITAITGLLITAQSAVAGDPAAGKALSKTCVSCHGEAGVSAIDTTPNLAGQKAAYLIKSTKDYRDGKRKDMMMESMVKSLSDADIENISAYYSSLK